ncbi:hypothetical protein BKA64DRAFT_555130, partial [Cadophora sp. MPI-SDFR-AT-0126]
HDSFPHFNHFPFEVRRLIWKCCLPCRIAEEDFPFTLLDGKESRQVYWPVRTFLLNSRVPLLALVCSEARAVVFEFGGHQINPRVVTSLDSIWLQPKIDQALHLNWTRRRDIEWYGHHDALRTMLDHCPMGMLIYRANNVYQTKTSLVAEYLYPFDLEQL